MYENCILCNKKLNCISDKFYNCLKCDVKIYYLNGSKCWVINYRIKDYYIEVIIYNDNLLKTRIIDYNAKTIFNKKVKSFFKTIQDIQNTIILL